MHSHNIAEVCNALKLLQLYEGALPSLFTTHSYNILEANADTLRLADVSNLMYALKADSPAWVKRAFVSAQYDRLSTGEVDAVLLSNIADHFMGVSLFPFRQLLYRFQKCLIDKSDYIFPYASRFSRVMRAMSQVKMTAPEIEAQFMDKLMDWLGSHKTAEMSNGFLSLTARYVLPRSKPIIHRKFFNVLCQSLPTWKTTELYGSVYKLL